MAWFPDTTESVIVTCPSAAMPPPDAVAPVPTEVARFELMVEDRMVSFPFDRMPPPVAVEGDVASFPVTVTLFSVRGPKAKIPAPASTAAPPGKIPLSYQAACRIDERAEVAGAWEASALVQGP